jgi:putative PIN family toxin of toxin-antitoxin system
VLVSGLLKRGSNPGKILDLIFEGLLQPVIDQRILDEYTVVLKRPHFQIPPQEALSVLLFLSTFSERMELGSIKVLLPDMADTGDRPFAEIAISGNVWALVTGNLRHFRNLAESGIRVLTPGDFLDEFERFKDGESI